jgi:hypothetical protein
LFRIVATNDYESRLREIEDFILESTDSIECVRHFLTAHTAALSFLQNNPLTPALHPVTGDRTWPFGDGRYRIFFNVAGKDLLLLDIIDNRMANLDVYPNNSMPTYDED